MVCVLLPVVHVLLAVMCVLLGIVCANSVLRHFLFCASKYRGNERAVAGQLFKLFNSIVVSENVNQRTSFVQAFVCEMIKCDSATTTFLAQFIPPNMVS